MDFQNDLLHKDGVMARNGNKPEPVESVVAATTAVMHHCKKARIPTVGCFITILTNAEGVGIGLGLFEKRFPYVKKEGFREGTWGHAFLEGLPAPDYRVRKWTFSPLFRTEL